ncbi:uncharacterized protein B0T15DRAFT_489422 [Chaetomium strumarium]|uniref:Uncharacterized protein n=1 Tax=Chaetomium strumarium TaxID=1170767 RepID=A0AAJ0H3A8_9PEZI|nr:hypothetical protein B0T15DRAFT_489422 [Chaetomium strumarium]
MLLTSGQVSIAISSGVVFLCTAALFLSGYALQQRTLRDLRAAIQTPKPSPKIFLPDRFKQSTTELPDGTIVTLDEDADDGDTRRKGEAIIEIKPTVLQDEGSRQQYVSGEKPTKTVKGKGRAKEKGGKGSAKEDGPDDNDGELQKPMSRAERRRRIKEEIMQNSQGEGPRGYYRRRRQLPVSRVDDDVFVERGARESLPDSKAERHEEVLEFDGELLCAELLMLSGRSTGGSSLCG